MTATIKEDFTRDKQQGLFYDTWTCNHCGTIHECCKGVSPHIIAHNYCREKKQW